MQNGFRDIRQLRNHWARPAGPPAYYWYLTFEDAPQLRALARHFQQAIAFPYYDLTPPAGLHLTLDKIAPESQVRPAQLAAIEAAAATACRQLPPFTVTVGALFGVPGAIGFIPSPGDPVRVLRDTLRAATLSAFPDATVSHAEFHPHVTIAYANTDGVPAAETAAAVAKLDGASSVEVTVTDGTVVLLERRPRSYDWQPVSKVPLSGGSRG